MSGRGAGRRRSGSIDSSPFSNSATRNKGTLNDIHDEIHTASLITNLRAESLDCQSAEFGLLHPLRQLTRGSKPPSGVTRHSVTGSATRCLILLARMAGRYAIMRAA
jgi:hypothetical protein